MSDVRGVGPVRAEALAARGVHTLQDLLFLVPLRYRQPAALRSVADGVAGERLSVVGWVRARRRGRLRRRGGNYLELGFEDEGSTRVRIRFYNQAWLFDRMPPGCRLLVSGTLSRTTGGVIVADHWALLEGQEDPGPRLDALLPVLPGVAGVSPGTLGRLVADAMEFAEALGDPLPASVREAAGVVPLPRALRAVHCPPDREAVEAGAGRLLFDRMLALALPLAAAGEDDEVPQLAPSSRTLERIRARFPFTFTPGQDAAFAAVLSDFESGRPMRRLLQGDVGCGKTAVALAAALAVIAGRRQVLFLAPTEPLAHQHRRVLGRFLQGSRVGAALYTSHTEASQRRRIEADAESGAADLVVATHAALSSRLTFKDLGLVIIDEQQRFGVRQRLLARAKGPVPHVLAMSATPIPRSLCLALMGDLDHTVIPDRPRGREPVVTRVDGGDAAFQAVREAVERGERAFIVLPA
ncbi:MAG: DEAD/DEAH box helicase, partial [Planctomycetes bacterium]|nr:DEAD/DEAH box helicase [Planctomycetota bacterium]